MNCKFDNSLMRDLTHGHGEGRNYICDKCGGHFYKDKWYSESEWYNYVNDFGDTDVVLVLGSGLSPQRFWSVKRVNALNAEKIKQLEGSGWYKRECTATEMDRLKKYTGREVCLGDIADQFFNGVVNE